ncbi:tyrosine-type recombinase/integrase [Bradyrhizobium japonicum]|uniref:tyrosine-type recombinase/integrase n=1 Tax=Bradyrhizobium japonicum TaxID=375 RepID=UPI0020A1DE53|nr:site-specific integrase [Bradyrhizobium japonicum]MCP1765408.1 integrase [Bradyrhizobium japonicum]MCP1787546.1 integrase [Bradyrhizobium japonicum]MCP1809422.1 integrase [Bradyrhizobium japonicum]MCP1818355.1 integrase [Bradyrhizobium japonicum]MCP1870135.1 integrase [Bradyrhizobium japonicum]
MPIIKIGRRSIAKLEPGEKPALYYDEDLAGFGIKVTPSGARSWFVEYRPGEGGRGVTKRRMVIGTPATLTPEKAREAAERLLAQVKLGGDPAAERAKARRADTVNDILDAYIKEHAVPHLKESSADLLAIYFDKHIRPVLGHKKSTSVVKADVASLHRTIGRTQAVTANRAIVALKGAYNHAIEHGSIPETTKNPAAGIKLFEEEPRERYLTEEELQRLGDALREGETVGLPHVVDETKQSKHARKPENRFTKIDQYAAAAIRLLLFTGCRLREILNLRWSEYDAGRGLLFLPTSKTGRKTVVLSAPAIAILDTLPRIGGYVIAPESAGQKNEHPRHDLNRPWRAIRKRSGIEDVHIHDLRHSFGAVGAGSGLGLPIIGRLLGHTQAATTARYSHVAIDPAKRAADLIAGQIADAMNGGK